MMDTFVDFQEWHRRKLEEFINGSIPDPNDLRETVAQLEVLPLMLDMGGCYALRSNKQVISFPWDDITDIRVENDPRIRNIALFRGSKKYPELMALIPPKPNNAIECSYCDGTGIEKTTAKLGLDSIICYCGGLGWLPRKQQIYHQWKP